MADRNIFEALREDHESQRTLADLLEKTQGASDGRSELFERFERELRAHAAAEERVFYARILEDELTRAKAGHSIKEHKEAETLLDELRDMDMSSPAWLPKLKQLTHDIRHHLDEEEQEVFQLAGKVLTDEQKSRLGAEFVEVKEAETDARR